MGLTLFPRTVFAALASLLASCHYAPRAIDVQEVREFPEYGGWLAVDSRGTVVPQYVVRETVQDGRVVFEVPTTREEAQARVRDARVRGALLPLEGAFHTALSPLALPTLFVAGAIGLYPLSHDSSATATAEVEVDVVDEHGTAVPGAQVELGSAVTVLRGYLDAGGRRTLGEPLPVRWRPSDALVAALALHLETFLLEPVRFEWNSRTFSSMDSRPGLRRPYSIELTDPFGHAQLDCTVPMPDSTDAVVSHVIAWAPGYVPAVHGLRGLRGRCTIELVRESGHDELREACRQLYEANRALGMCIREKGWINPGTIDHDLLDQAAGVLRGIREDLRWPRWLRGNAELALEEHLELRAELYEYAGSYWVIPRDRKADKRAPELTAELERLRAERANPSRNYGEAATDPHRLAEEFALWIAACEVIGLDPSEDPTRAVRQAELAAEALTLIERLEALDPTQPPIESLRSILALHEGDRERAVALSRFLDHPRYFAIFYGSLRKPAGTPSEVPAPSAAAPKP